MDAPKSFSENARIVQHPVLGGRADVNMVELTFDGRALSGVAGEPISAVLLAHGMRVQRTASDSATPPGFFCGVGRCANCLVSVDGEPGVRACVAPVRAGMVIESRDAFVRWEAGNDAPG